MDTTQSQTKVKSAELHATIRRADGTVEDLGVISFYHANPIKRALWWFRRKRTSH